MKHYQIQLKANGKPLTTFGEYENITQAAREVSLEFKNKGKVVSDLTVTEVAYEETIDKKTWLVPDAGEVIVEKIIIDSQKGLRITLNANRPPLNLIQMKAEAVIDPKCDADEEWQRFSLRDAAPVVIQLVLEALDNLEADPITMMLNALLRS